MRMRFKAMGNRIALCVLLVSMVLLAGGRTMAEEPGTTPLEIGATAPDFKLHSTTGNHISLSQFRGKKLVLLEFYGVDFAPT